MAPESLWTQYSIIGILVLSASVIARAFYKLWKDWMAWITAQDIKREEERERQRMWQERLDVLRDERWHAFLSQMQDEWTQENGRHSARIEQLIIKVDALINSVNSHDTFVRAISKKDVG